jgi:chemotaxis family two-component system sensor kinase Cph1
MIEALVRASPEAIILLDDASRVTLFNSGAEAMFGYVPTEVVGQLIDFLLPEAVGELRWTSPLPPLLARAHGQGDAPVQFALFGQRSDGEIFSVDATVASALVPPSRGFIVVVRDSATSLRAEGRLRECEECFRIAFESETIAFAITELSGRLRTVNRSLCNLLGYSESELLEHSFQSITHPDDLHADVSNVRRLVAGEIDRYLMEKRYIHKQGHSVWVLLSVSLVRDRWGAPLYFVAHATDITSLKTAQRALEERAAELERSNAELEHFASVASHDLQEPLRTVSSYTQLLTERYRGQLDDRADRWINYIVGGVDHMKRLIDGLLALARIRTDGGAFQPVNTGAIIEQLWARLCVHPKAEGANLSRGPLPVVCADASQIEQLFQNLLSNAIKYRRSDEPLRVDISAEPHLGSNAIWQFEVADNGIGLDMANATRIFEIFQRVARDTDQTGAGIGLAVCDRIVRRHGGRIWVESEPGRGARFCFTLVDQST